ncbi:MAG: hypothetical protein V3G42_11365 [Oscillospiraceae bacterium]
MEEKYYIPVIKENEHLTQSKKNPHRVRGTSRDENNKNPDIPEFEVIDKETIREEIRKEIESEKTFSQSLSDAAIDASAQVIANLLIAGMENIVIPWFKDSVLPKISNKLKDKKKSEIPEKEHPITIKENIAVDSFDSSVFEQSYSNMEIEKIKEHLMNIIYHIFSMAKEILSINYIYVRKNCDSRKEWVKNQETFEKYLAEQVAISINKLLSNEALSLDVDTSKKIFSLMGGGVYMNNEYVPVETSKVIEIIHTKDLK